MMKALCFLLIILTVSSGGSETLSLRGVVPSYQSVHLTPYPIAINLPLQVPHYRLPVARYKIISNKHNLQSRLKITSLHQGFLKYQSGSERIPYTFHTGNKELFISYDFSWAEEIVPGYYCDTLTLRAENSEALTMLELCGEI